MFTDCISFNEDIHVVPCWGTCNTLNSTKRTEITFYAPNRRQITWKHWKTYQTRLLRESLRLGRWTATTVQKTTLKQNKNKYISVTIMPDSQHSLSFQMQLRITSTAMRPTVLYNYLSLQAARTIARSVSARGKRGFINTAIPTAYTWKHLKWENLSFICHKQKAIYFTKTKVVRKNGSAINLRWKHSNAKIFR